MGKNNDVWNLETVKTVPRFNLKVNRVELGLYQLEKVEGAFEEYHNIHQPSQKLIFFASVRGDGLRPIGAVDVGFGEGTDQRWLMVCSDLLWGKIKRSRPVPKPVEIPIMGGMVDPAVDHVE